MRRAEPRGALPERQGAVASENLDPPLLPILKRAGLAGLLLGFLMLELFLPLRTAVIIGADEWCETAKLTELLHGHKFYSEVWNDQPPLHTLVIRQMVRWFGHSILSPRLVSVFCGMVVIASLFVMAQAFPDSSSRGDETLNRRLNHRNHRKTANVSVKARAV